MTAAGPLTYSLARSARRRTMAICIEEHQRVKVFAPRHLSENIITGFLQEKIGWIERKIAQGKSLSRTEENFSCRDGAKFLFLGQLYPLCYQPTERKRVALRFVESEWQVFVPWDMPCDQIEPAIVNALKAWYKKQAKDIVAQRVSLLGVSFGVQPEQVFVKTQRRLWGSCYPRRRKIYINWKIVMAPIEVLDYVIIHELCHLREANHSKRFWKHVKKSVASYQDCTQWLKVHAPLMKLP